MCGSPNRQRYEFCPSVCLSVRKNATFAHPSTICTTSSANTFQRYLKTNLSVIQHGNGDAVITLNESPFQSYEGSPAIWDHTVLPRCRATSFIESNALLLSHATNNTASNLLLHTTIHACDSYPVLTYEMLEMTTYLLT